MVHIFWWDFCAQSVIVCVLFCRLMSVFCPFSFEHYSLSVIELQLPITIW